MNMNELLKVAMELSGKINELEDKLVELIEAGKDDTIEYSNLFLEQNAYYNLRAGINSAIENLKKIIK